MNNVPLRTCLVLGALVWTGCGDGDGDSNPTNSGGTQNGGSGGAQGGSSAGGSKASGGSAGSSGGAGGVAGSGGASGGSGGASAGAGGANGGSAGASGGAGGDTFACGPLTCQRDEELCHREPPALPGGTEQRMCEPFPGDCAARDCSCFCDAGDEPPCQTEDFCMCSDQNGAIELVCAGA